MQLKTRFVKCICQYSKYFLFNCQKIWLVELIAELGRLSNYTEEWASHMAWYWLNRNTGGGHTWKFFSISNNRFRPVSAIFLSVWRNAHIIESITSFSCWYWTTWDRRLQFNGEGGIVKRLPLKFSLFWLLIVQFISPLLQFYIHLSDVV
jgi:hypothetical protein